MLNSKSDIIEQLRILGLSRDEARLYLELLKEPSTHLRLAHATGINRSKVYRLAEDLEKRSLVTHRTDDRGTFLVACDPATLEVEIVTQESRLQAQRTAFKLTEPLLASIKANRASDFALHAYEGVQGFKQMLWHELKAKGENLIFGSGTIEDLVPERRWAERHRALTVEAGYSIRELLNPGDKDKPFTLNEEFMDRYKHRTLPSEVLLLQNQISIYNDTVATYHWRQGQKVGFEVINQDHANMMRQMFEQYWQLADSHK